jgi:hypothetical protein
MIRHLLLWAVAGWLVASPFIAMLIAPFCGLNSRYGRDDQP